MLRVSSILDYQNNELSPIIWRPDQTMKSGIKSFIRSSIIGFFDELDIKGYKHFVEDILIGSSLATYFYTNTSDLDIKIIVDIPVFKNYNESYADSASDDILSELIESGRDSFWLTQMIPGTSHPIDAYFYSIEEISHINMLKYDSLYRMSDDVWIKRPEKIDGKISPSYVLNYAKDKAQKYLDKIVADIEQTKRDSIDFLLLKEYMKSLPEEDLHKLYVDFQVALERVNDDARLLVNDRDALKEMRTRAFSKDELRNDLEKNMRSFNYSDENLVFKLMQRYGYMRILSEIKKLFNDNEISSDEVKNVLRATNTV